MKKEGLVRSFIAIDFPDDIIKEVARVQEVLNGRKFTGKMTELENLHLTLKFLGEIEEKKVEEIKKKLKEIKFKEFELKLGEAGTFSYKGNPKIVWIKIEGKDVWDLQKKIDDKVKEAGFKLEERFMSHLTVARLKYVKDKKAYIDYVKNLGVKEIKFKINSFKFLKSELKPLGPVYTLIEEYNSY